MNSKYDEKEHGGKDPRSSKKKASHEPTAVKRDPEYIKEGISGAARESKYKLSRGSMTKGTEKA